MLRVSHTVVLLAMVVSLASPTFSQLAQPVVQSATSESDILASVLGVPSPTPLGPEDVVQAYEIAMQAITQQLSARMAAIAGAVNRGELTREQGESLSAEQYEQSQMQFDLLSALREILQQDIARAATVPRPVNATTTQSEVVMVALPFSSLQLNTSVIEYLDLSSAQVASIEKLMSDERRNLVPLMTQMQETREQLLSVGDQGRSNDDKEVRSLAAVQARNLMKVIVSNSRMRTKIYQLLSPAQQKKLDEIQRQ
jgi:hypothetical protein